MLVDTRVVNSNNFINFERNDEGHVIGRLIRLAPAGAESSRTTGSGQYTAYSTSECNSIGDAELEIFTILERLDGSEA
jgi:hypothetical protein